MKVHTQTHRHAHNMRAQPATAHVEQENKNPHKKLVTKYGHESHSYYRTQWLQKTVREFGYRIS